LYNYNSIAFLAYRQRSYTNMPLPEDKAVVETSDALVKTLRGAFGTPESYRPGQSSIVSMLSNYSTNV